MTALNPFIIYSPLVKDGLGLDPEGNGYGGAVSSYSHQYCLCAKPHDHGELKCTADKTVQFWCKPEILIT